MDELCTLKREKATLKGKVTRIENFIENLTEPLSDEIETELKIKLDIMKNISNGVCELRKNYFKLPENVDISEAENDITDLDIRLEDIEVRLKKLLNKFNLTHSLKNFDCQQNKLSVENSTKISPDVKLPKLSLPTFNGNVYEWITFNDLFKAAVHDNSNLSDGQKLQYLLSALKGDALRVVKSISISDENYKIAWALLEERFSNHREQVFAHIKRFFSIPSINNESASALLNLVDITFESTRALEILNCKVEGFADTMFVYILLQKLDPSTKLWFEREFGKKNTVPKLSDLIEFLKNYARTLEASKISKNTNQKHYVKNTVLLTNNNVKSTKCIFCFDDHIIYKCSKFQEISVNDRVEFLKKQKLCFNCFFKHGVKNCSSKFSCKKCGKKHNTLIHFDKVNRSLPSVQPQTFVPSNSNTEINNSSPLNPNATSFEMQDNMSNSESRAFVGTSYKCENNFKSFSVPRESKSLQGRKKYTFLSTAVIDVRMQNGQKIKISALLDVGSQVSLIRKEIADLLKIKQESINAPISGLNNSLLTVKRKLSTVVENSKGDFKRNVEFFIVNNITDLTLSKPLDVTKISFPTNVCYADPNFYRPSKVDALLGADIFYELLKPNQINLKDESIVLQETVFGWVVSGCMNINEQQSYQCGLVNNFEYLDNQLTKFWDLESLGIRDADLKNEEDKALQIFNETVCFKNGRYEVSLPWKRNREELGDNYEVAKKRLESLVKRMKRDNSLYLEYCDILNSYLSEGIIEKVTSPTNPVNKALYYLPHQAVIRKESLTTKVRIVFDASSHEPGQLSLNDCLYQGVNLNPNIFHLLTFFRLNKIAFMADIEKAFLQISLCEKDTDYVRFLFIDDMNNIQTYKFKRIIFGVNASPFLLAVTIKKHIEKYREEFPATVQILDTCFYVDDLVTGSENVLSALKISKTAEKIMKYAGMSLRKWISNSQELTNEWEAVGFKILHPEDLKNSVHRVLGLLWNPCTDYLSLEIDSLLEFLQHERNTKRYLIMAAGRIFDPLGLVTPFTIRFKCLFQEIWQRKLSWDETLPPDISKKWLQWCKEVPQLKKFSVPRYILGSFFDQDSELEIHTFSDASIKAYGAVMYIKFKIDNQVLTNLVASKSRVAPLKKLSLPRLELMGALLAARLASDLKPVIDKKQKAKCFFWSDSQITLYWIQGATKRWKQFVANRVKEIQELTTEASWHHCSGKDNPADLLTRGADAESLLSNQNWLTGPAFLKNIVPEPAELNVTKDEYSNELKKDFKCDNDILVTLNATTNYSFFNCLFDLSNDYMHILRVLSFLFRFIFNVRHSQNKKVGHITAAELQQAEIFLIKKAQSEDFPLELKSLSKGESVAPNSKLKSLAPFLDNEGIIRVGGRLKNSNLEFCKKHPVVLPQKNSLTNVIVMYFHKKCFHVGPQTLLYYVREKFWPLNGRNICRKICHDCVVCFKANPSISEQLMGNLPPERINENFAFNVTGIDFCGPFLVKYKNQRKGAVNKVYVTIFVCLATRAIHLEIVTDLTTPTFISCLKRFFSRRGKSRKLLTDNAQTFVGAASELKRLFNMVKSPDELLAGYLSSEGIDWKFIPPKAPNFGGLWEAGVKSFKYHLKRVVGNTKLTMEEFLTVVTQVEGFLNSRPISPMSSDPNDYRVLSPGHFLIGREITSIPEPSLVSMPENRLSHWQKITKYVQKIWQLWHLDYFSNLQQRGKWAFDKNNVKVGSVVLIKEDNLPPNKWQIARIAEIYPSNDGKIRVVKLQLSEKKNS